MPRASAAFAAVLFAACSFDQGGVSFGDGGVSPADAGMTADGSVGADAQVTDGCVPGCVGDQLVSCEPPGMQACDLGCNPTTVSCNTIAPSNDVDQDQLVGVTQALVFAQQSTSTIDSDTGQIVTGGVTIVRGPGGGVVDGIRYEQLSDSVAVIGVTELNLGQDSYIRVVGSRALILLSAGDVTINGAIDVSGGCVGGGVTCGGPGGGSGTPDEAIAATGCAPGGNGTGGTGVPPETGGGGGSFGAAGAPGGDGNASNPGGSAGALPGMCSGPTLVPLMGGSGGGSGGIDNCGGDGGGGGGGLQITSYTQIDITGPGMNGRPVGINAAGSGGRGGEASDGGGGGGSGGGILLEAPTISLTDATLAANGGAGGGGGDQPDSSVGQSGTFGDMQAVGGDDTREGGLGGSVQGAATAGEGGGDNTGGGGGGVGVIRLNVTQTGLTMGGQITISPAFTRGDPGVK